MQQQQQQQPVNGTQALLPVTFGHPIAVPQSPPPPPPPQQVMSPPPQVGLGRSNMVSSVYATPLSPPSQVNLARSGTVGSGYQPQRQYSQPQQVHHHQHPQQVQQQQQYVHQQYQQDQYRQSLIANAPVPPTSVLSLPSAPTEAPAGVYGVKEERKEALLIDL